MKWRGNASVTTTRGLRTQLNISAMNECVAYGSSSANDEEDVEHIYDEMDEVPINSHHQD